MLAKCITTRIFLVRTEVNTREAETERISQQKPLSILHMSVRLIPNLDLGIVPANREELLCFLKQRADSKGYECTFCHTLRM